MNINLIYSKSAILIFTLNIIFFSRLFAQERIQSIDQGVLMIGKPRQQMSNYLANEGFNFQSGSGNSLGYVKKNGMGSNNYLVAYKNQKVNVISWTEYIAHLNNILSELKSEGFVNDKSVDDVKMYGFKNYQRNIMVVLIIREDMNDISIQMARINESKSVAGIKKQPVYSKILPKPETPISKTDISKVPNAPDSNINFSEDSAFKKDDLLPQNSPLFYWSNDTFLQGVITDVKKDRNGDPIEMLVFYKSENNPDGIYDDVIVKDDAGFGVWIYPTKIMMLRADLIPGRKIFYQTISIDPKSKNAKLVYLRPLPQNTTIPLNK